MLLISGLIFSLVFLPTIKPITFLVWRSIAYVIQEKFPLLPTKPYISSTSNLNPNLLKYGILICLFSFNILDKTVVFEILNTLDILCKPHSSCKSFINRELILSK